MSDQHKTKAELLSELSKLRQEVARLKAVEGECLKLREQIAQFEPQGEAEETLTKRALELEEVTNFLDSIIENLPTMLFVKDAEELRFVRWNKAGEELTGFTREEFMGKNDYDFFPKEEADFFTAKDREVLNEGKLLDIPEELIQTKQRGTRLLHTRKIPIYGSDGKPKYLLGISEDITEWKQAEEALRQSEGYYRSLFEDSPISLWDEDFSELKTYIDSLRDQGIKDFRTFFAEHPDIVDDCMTRLKVIDINQSTLRLYGAKSKDELLNNLGRVLREETRDIFLDELAAIGEGRTNLQREGVSYSLTDKRIDMSLGWSVAHGYEDTLSKVIISIMDITERKQVEEVVRASEERLRAFVNALPDIAFILDEQGRYVEIMAAEENLLYAGIAQLKGKLLHEVLPQEDADLFLGTVRQTIETGKPQILEYALGVQAGQTWFEGRTSPVRGLVGGQRAVVWVSRDITAYKLAEVALAKRAAELETVAQVSTAISTILDTTELLQTVSDLAKERFGLYHAHIYLLNEIGDTLVLAAGAGEAGRQMIAQGWSIPLEKERSLVVQAVRTRQGVIINDVRQEPKFMPNLLLPETQAEIAVPLLVGEQVLGVLDVQADTVDRFTQEDVRIQTIMAGQIVGALQNARLFVEQQQARLLLDERVKELNCLNEIGREIVETPPVSELLQWVTERIPSAMRYPEICATAIEYNGQIYGAPEAIDLTCQIVHALRIGGEIMGRIYISYAEKRDFLDEESALIGGIASRLSGYIESQRLLEQVQDALAVQEHLTVELDSQRRTLHAVLDNMPAGVFVAEAPAGKPVLANEQLKQLLGRGIALDVNNKETAEMYAIYRYGTDTLYPPDQTPLARGLLGEITTIDDMEVRQPDGSRILLQVVGAPIRDPQGSVSASVAIFQDITERKRAEMALWENQQLLRGFIDNSEAIIFVKDLQGRYLLVNNQFEILFNISKHEAVGKTDLDIFPKELARELRANDLKVLEARTSSQVEESVMFDDGPHTYLSLKFPFLDTAGVPYALGGISTNITETKRAEEVLRENQARLSEALNIARLAYWEFDLETQNLTFNDQFYAIFKTTAEQEGGHVMPAAKYAQKFVHPDDAGLIAREIQMLAESDDPNYTSQLEYRIIRADGEEGYLLVQFRRDQRGQSIGAVGIVQDITERKQSELEREKLLAEVEAAYRQYVRQEWQQFLGEQHQGNWHVEYQQVGSSSTEVEPSELDKTLAGAQNEVFSEGKTKIITGTNGNNQGNEAAIIAPIVLRGQVIGTFSLQDLAAERQWAAEEIALVEAVSEQLGVTIENLRLFDDTQKQATREQLTRQIADKMRAAPDVESIIQTGLTELGKALGVSRSYVKLTPKE